MNKQLYTIHLNFSGPLHLGSNKLDYGQSETRLRSDTLYSAIFQTWALIGKEGWIPTAEHPQPNFSISSGFPYYFDEQRYHHFFPRPYGRLFSHNKKQEQQFIDQRKALKKIEYLHEDAFMEWCKNGEIQLNTKLLKGAFYAKHLPEEKLYYSQVSPRVKVAREDGEDATPFSVDRLYFYKRQRKKEEKTASPNAHAGMYFLFYGDEQALKRLTMALKILQDEGLGTDRKVGHGQFTFDVETFSTPDWSGNASINLSLLLPDSADWVKQHAVEQESGGYSLMERGGWITTPGLNSYRKNMLHFFEEGSVFGQPCDGIHENGTVKDVYPKESLTFEQQPHPVWRVGKGILFPVNIS